MFIKVFDPDTVKDPVITVEPLTSSLGVIIVPELLDIVPADPVGP